MDGDLERDSGPDFLLCKNSIVLDTTLAVFKRHTPNRPTMGILNHAAIATTLSVLTVLSLAHTASSSTVVLGNFSPVTAGLDALPTPAQDLRRRAASSSIVNLHIPDADDQAILASVITANPTATSYLLTCPTDEPAEDCGLGTGIRVLEGPSTLEVHMTLGQTSDDITCRLSGDTADCDQASKGADGSTTAVMQFQGISSWLMPVTVTAGLDALATTSGPSATTSSSSSNAASPTGSSEGTSSSNAVSPTGSSQSTPASSGTGAAQSSKATTATTGGAVAVTGNAVVAGIAAVLGCMLVV